MQTADNLEADLVKVAHHGSRVPQPEFIDAAKAKIAIIPVGKRSQFGHPHQEVIERWKSSGTRILTTGENGTISVVSDGSKLELKTFLPKNQ